MDIRNSVTIVLTIRRIIKLSIYRFSYSKIGKNSRARANPAGSPGPGITLCAYTLHTYLMYH